MVEGELIWGRRSDGSVPLSWLELRLARSMGRLPWQNFILRGRCDEGSSPRGTTGGSGYRKMACNGDWVAPSFGDGGRRLQGTDQTGIGSNRHDATSSGPTRGRYGPEVHQAAWRWARVWSFADEILANPSPIERDFGSRITRMSWTLSLNHLIQSETWFS
jgi:hypothetical protein